MAMHVAMADNISSSIETKSLTTSNVPGRIRSNIVGYVRSYCQKVGDTYNRIQRYDRYGLELEDGQIANLEFNFTTWNGDANFNISIIAYQNSYDTGITFQTLTASQMQDYNGIVQRKKWENIDRGQNYTFGINRRTSLSVSIKCLKDGDKYKYIIKSGGADVTLTAPGHSIYGSGVVIFTSISATSAMYNYDYSISYGIGGYVDLVGGTLYFDSKGLGSGIPSKPYDIGCTFYDLYGWNMPSPTPYQDNLKFGGWYYDSACTMAVGTWDRLSTAPITLYAKWISAETKVTVSFNSNGGSSCSARQYTVGSTYGTLPEPTKSESTFDGWYSDSSLTKRVSASSTVLSTVTTLYAKWTAIPSSYTVKLVKNDGTDNAKSYTRTAGGWTIPSASSLSWSRSGYDFLGWSTSSTATSAKYSDGQAIAISGNTTLYAVWKAKPQYTVKLYMNDGTSTSKIYTQIPSGTWEIPKISSISWARSGYVFAGWNTSSTATTIKYLDGDYISVSGALTLYAIWQAIPVEILPSPSIQSVGKIYSGSSGYADALKIQWSPVDKATGYAVYRSSSATGGGTRELIKPTIGTINTYNTINGQTTFTQIYFAEDKTALPGVDYSYWVVATNSLAKSEYGDFKSSYLPVVLDLSKTKIQFNDANKASSDITVTANAAWSAVSSDSSWLTLNASSTKLTATVKANATKEGKVGVITVTAAAKTAHPVSKSISVFQSGLVVPEYTLAFDANGGNGSATMTVEKNNAIGTLPTATRSGYLLLGWFTGKDSGSKITESTKVTGDATYYAHWQYVGSADDTTIVSTLKSVYFAGEDGTFSLDLSSLIGSTSVPKLTVKGLPSGVKYDSKTMTISGMATKPGVYSVSINATNATVKKPVVIVFALEVPNFRWSESKVGVSLGDRYVLEAGTAPDLEHAFDIISEGGWKLAVAGLPAGVKFDSKNGVLTGVATKEGFYTVTFTVTRGSGRTAEKEVSTATFEVVFPELSLEASAWRDGKASGSVTGGGKYPAGKKVTIKAVPAKDSVFIGWYDSAGRLLATKASHPYVTSGEEVTLTAVFATLEEDKASISSSLSSYDDEESFDLSPDSPYILESYCGVTANYSIDVTALSPTTVKVSGLPAGVKFVQDNKTGEKLLTGVPTVVSKEDASGNPIPFHVKLTVTTANKTSQTYIIDWTIMPLPAWAVGYFNGVVGVEEGPVQALTIAANGKISVKLTDEFGKTWSLAASQFDSADDTEFRANVIGKSGANVVTNEMVVYCSSGYGMIESDNWFAWQNLWKRADIKNAMPAFKSSLSRVLDLGDYGYKGNSIVLTFKKDGVVSFAGKIDGTSVSGTSQLFLSDNNWQALLYAPPKGAFEGFSFSIAVALETEDIELGTGVFEHRITDIKLL